MLIPTFIFTFANDCIKKQIDNFSCLSIVYFLNKTFTHEH